MAENAKGLRITFVRVLVCTLAACSVMYMAQDDATEHVMVPKPKVDVKYDVSIETADIEKVPIIYSQTPDGRQRLLIYFRKLEKLIAKEAGARKVDIEAVRAQMARNQAYNAAASKKMKAVLLKKMANNAKESKRKLHAAMRKTTAKFAAAAELGNKRNKANLARSKKTREVMRKNKRAGAKHLAAAVKTMQRSLAAVSQAVNKRITQTNKHIAANGAAIKENARIARKNLAKAMQHFNHKMANASEQAKKGRSKLASQAVALNKRTRAMIQNKINAVAASTASQFNKVRTQMAKDRQRADMMLKHATSRMQASLNANRALMDKRFAKTVADLAAAKKEARARIRAASAEFKISLLHITATVKNQCTKLNSRVTQLAGVVANNKLEQDKVNRNVNAEIKRMVKLGNQRYQAELKKDRELHSLMKRNQAATRKSMDNMAKAFNSRMASIQRQLKRDRAHASHMLARRTNALYSTLKANAKKQAAASKALTQQSARARYNLMHQLRASKASFAKRLAKLHSTIVRNDKKANKKIAKLTGLVQRNAVKDAAGRKLLKYTMKANALELKTSIRNAVHKGEQRALKLMKNMKEMNKKSAAALNQQIAVKIGHLAEQTHRSIAQVRMESRAARAALKQELTLAVKAAAQEAKKNLAASVKASQMKFLAVQKAMTAARGRSAAARAGLLQRIKRNQLIAQRSIKDAVAEQTRSLLALKMETAKSIKATNKRVDAAASQMKKNAKNAAAQMKANIAALNAKINAAKAEAKKGLKTAESASASRQAQALTEIRKALTKARKAEDSKFKRIYLKMAKNRSRVDQKLAGMSSEMNNALAKQAALQDARFRKTVKNISKARAEAVRGVANARKAFTMSLASATSMVKAQETRMSNEIAVVSAAVLSNKQSQARVNRRVNAELKKIVKIENHRHSVSMRARGKLRKLMNQNKKASAAEVAQLAKRTVKMLKLVRRQAAKWRRQAATSLTKETQTMYSIMAAAQKAQLAANKRFTAANRAALAAALYDVKKVKVRFSSKLTVLANTVTANNKRFQRNMRYTTGVSQSQRAQSKTDMKLMVVQRKSMNVDLNKAITRSVQLGEARAKAKCSAGKMSATRKAMMTELASKCERAADKTYKTIGSNRAIVADNYLSVKAYTGAAKYDLEAYVAQAKGKGLSSVGDFLVSVARISAIRAKPEGGIGAGQKALIPLFGGKRVKVNTVVSKVNGLTNEYIRIVTQVRQRWPMGLGKYLLSRMEMSMQKKGILQVDRMTGKSGNFVFINGHSVGLSNKLKDFNDLAKRMPEYEEALAALTKKLARHAVKKIPKKPLFIKPPQWQGN